MFPRFEAWTRDHPEVRSLGGAAFTATTVVMREVSPEAHPGFRSWWARDHAESCG